MSSRFKGSLDGLVRAVAAIVASFFGRRLPQRTPAPSPRVQCLRSLARVNELLLRGWQLVRHQQGRTWDVVAPLYCAVQDSCASVALLSRCGQVRDSYSISRCVLETSLNATYILAAGDEVAEKAYRHYMQKCLREMDRNADFMREYLGSNLQAPEWRQSGELADVLDEFTAPNGRERTWAGASIEKRLQTIRKAFGRVPERMLRVALHSLYHPASEILHGTFYGAMRSSGQADLPLRFQSHFHYVRWLGDQLSLVDVMSAAAAAVLLKAVGDTCGATELGDEAIRTARQGAVALRDSAVATEMQG